MSEWSNRIRLASSSYKKGEGWFTFRAATETEAGYHRARGYVENIINAGMKPDILDAIRDEASSRELELEQERHQHHITKLALELALEKLTGWEEKFIPLCHTLGIPLPAPYNQGEAQHGKR